MTAKNKVGMVIFIIIFAIWTVYGIISGALGLTKGSYTDATVNAEVGKLCEVQIDYAEEVYTITHTVNFIPTGKEHLYWCVSDEEGVELLIKAKKSWFDANFDQYGFAGSTVIVKGEVMKMDYKFEKDLADFNKELAPFGMKISTTKYISSNYKTLYTLRLLSGVFMIVGATATLVLIHRGVGGKFTTLPAFLAMLFAAFVLLFGETV